MKHTLKTSDTGAVEIKVATQSAERPKLMENLQQCQSGQCGCKTNVYEDLDGIELAQTEGGVEISLTPKDGADIDTGEVEKCLDWMAEQAKEK